MAEYQAGDQVVCLIKDRAIVNAHEHEFDFEYIFDIIIPYAEGYILYIPVDLHLDDCMELTKHNLERFKIEKKFYGSSSYYITEYKIVRLHQKLDGLSCARCRDFFQMASPNQEDGTMLCYSCRLNPYR